MQLMALPLTRGEGAAAAAAVVVSCVHVPPTQQDIADYARSLSHAPRSGRGAAAHDLDAVEALKADGKSLIQAKDFTRALQAYADAIGLLYGASGAAARALLATCEPAVSILESVHID
jgi:hypothetical protein